MRVRALPGPPGRPAIAGIPQISPRARNFGDRASCAHFCLAGSRSNGYSKGGIRGLRVHFSMHKIRSDGDGASLPVQFSDTTPSRPVIAQGA